MRLTPGDIAKNHTLILLTLPHCLPRRNLASQPRRTTTTHILSCQKAREAVQNLIISSHHTQTSPIQRHESCFNANHGPPGEPAVQRARIHEG